MRGRLGNNTQDTILFSETVNGAAAYSRPRVDIVISQAESTHCDSSKAVGGCAGEIKEFVNARGRKIKTAPVRDRQSAAVGHPPNDVYLVIRSGRGKFKDRSATSFKREPVGESQKPWAVSWGQGSLNSCGSANYSGATKNCSASNSHPPINRTSHHETAAGDDGRTGKCRP